MYNHQSIRKTWLVIFQYITYLEKVRPFYEKFLYPLVREHVRKMEYLIFLVDRSLSIIHFHSKKNILNSIPYSFWDSFQLGYVSVVLVVWGLLRSIWKKSITTSRT